jgi:hypothetical protein
LNRKKEEDNRKKWGAMEGKWRKEKLKKEIKEITTAVEIDSQEERNYKEKCET